MKTKVKSVADWMVEFQKRLIERELSAADLFELAGYSKLTAGAPSAFVLHRLYEKPNVYVREGDVRVCTAWGLERDVWDSRLGVEKHWQFLEDPEVVVREGFNAFDHVTQREDVSLFFKVHALQALGVVALNPIQYPNFQPQDQEFVYQDYRRLQAELEAKLKDTHVGDKPRHPWKIRDYLEKAIDAIDGNYKAAIFRYPRRDKIGVVVGTLCAQDLNYGGIAFPAEDNLRRRWGDVSDATLSRYKKLEEFAFSGSHGLSVYEFDVDKEGRVILKELKKT